MGMFEKIVGALKEFMKAEIWSKEWIRRCYPRFGNNIWFDINKYLVQKERITITKSETNISQIDLILTW